mgnify:CR=1 FL=1
MFKDWNFKALGLKNASSDENMMLIAFVNYFLQRYEKLCISITVFGKKLKSKEKGREKLGREKLRS